MIFFIIIVFISQIVLLTNIVVWIITTDKKVCILSEEIANNNVHLEKRLKAIKQITEDLHQIFPYLMKKFIRKRNNLIVRTLNELLQGTVLFFFKPKYKKFLLGLKVGIGAIKDLSKR